MTELSRRSLLASAAVLPGAALLSPRAATASAELMGPSFSQFRRFPLGGFEVTTILAGTAQRDDPQSMFGTNVSQEEFAEVGEANFLPVDTLQAFFTPTVVNTGSELILFDTGLNAAATTGVLQSAGYQPEQFDTVVITHMHGDHVGGLITAEGTPTFPNARYVTGAAEHNHWSNAGSETYQEKVAPLVEQFTFIDDGASVASGVTSMAAFGHTPGQMLFRIEDAGQSVLVFADTASHPVWSLAYPEWEVRFDMDKEAAGRTRRRVLSMLADERMPFIGYHMPFPAIGYVETRGDGFRYVPESYQFRLG